MMQRQIFGFIAVFCLLLTLGCGKGHVGYTGKVVFSDDGSPLTVGTVCFATSTFQAKGDLKSDGTFTIGSYGPGDGLPPGTYQVGILAATEDLGGDLIYSLVDPKWGSPQTSGYTVTVEDSMKNVEIKVDRNPESKEDTKKKGGGSPSMSQ